MKSRRSALFIGLIICLLSIVVLAGENTPKHSPRTQAGVNISIRPIGPSQAIIDAAKVLVMQSDAVQRELTGKKFYLISFEAIENGSPDPTAFRAIFYDHTTDRTLVATADFAGKQAVTIHEESLQPVPSDEEFDAAIQILQTDGNFAPQLKAGTVKAFRPMPPVTILEGTTDRLINVGIDANGPAGRNEVVSVSIKDGKVIRYPENAPPISKASPEACGIPSAGQSTTSSGTAGQYQMSVTQGGSPLWDMLIVRPSASSGGSNRSGIEVRDVKYKGKSVLKRGHVPILDVQYVGGQCGPYRDWQYQEDNFQTPASGNTDPAPGIRIIAPGQIPTTALESGVDAGNFRGVAVYTQNKETVLVTEFAAGWYRYVMEWRFGDDGIIRPRFGFGATDNSCVCFSHNHHVYWRLDFDVVTPNNRVYVVERGRKFLKPIATETFMNKSPQTNRSILIQNATSDEAYMLVPSVKDGVVDAFGVHDIWVLAYKGTAVSPTELDDGRTCCGGPNQNIAIDPWLNNESVDNQDVVIWYGAHFLHSDGANLVDAKNSPSILGTSHVVGPDIRPVRW